MMKRVCAFLVFVCLVSAAVLSEEALGLKDVVGMVMANDPNVSSSQQSASLALHTYKGTIAQSFPQIDFKGSYGLAYTPSIENQIVSYPPPTFVEETADLTAYDQATHSIAATLSLSQLLPTGGNAFLDFGDTMTAITMGSLDTTSSLGTETTYPDPEYAQKPSFTLGITQPIFLNGKLIDLELFPAILRKAQIGWQKADHQNLLQTNQAVAQAVQLFLTIVQLRKGISQSEASLAVAQGSLDNLQRNLSLGLASESDVLDAKIGVSTQKQAILEQRSNLSRAEKSLAHSMGRETISGIALVDDIPSLEIKEPREELVSLALSASPAVLQQTLAAEEKRVDDILAGQKYASTLSLSFSYAPRYPFTDSPPYTSTDFGHSFSDLYGDGSGTDWSFQASITVHLFDGGQARETHAANRALTRVGDNSLTSQRQSIQDQLELDLQSIDNLKEKVALLSDSVTLAARRLETEKNLLSLGKSTRLNVDSKSADHDARFNELWKARADLMLVVIDIASLTGKDIATLIQGSIE